jgi:acyl-CoA synthetase (AMP-forming)/AMP-acid ligase II
MMNSSLLWKKWQKTVHQAPRRVVLIDVTQGRTFNRTQLYQEALGLSQSIFRDATKRRVALCWPNSTTWIASFLALQKQGAAVLALDASLPAEAQEEAARSAGVDWLYSQQLGLVPLRSRRSARNEFFARPGTCWRIVSTL